MVSGTLPALAALPWALPPAHAPSARRGVRASVDRYGRNRTAGVHVSWPDADSAQVQVQCARRYSVR